MKALANAPVSVELAPKVLAHRAAERLVDGLRAEGLVVLEAGVLRLP